MAWFDERRDVTYLAVGRLVDESVEVDGTVVLAPETAIDEHLAEEAVVELEIIDAEVGIYGNILEQAVGFQLACGQAGKLHIVEVYEAENILQVDALEVGIERVGVLLRHTSVDAQVAPLLGHFETIYVERSVAETDIRWPYIPRCIRYDYLSWVKGDVES